MTEEANEYIVKLFLESDNYLVTTNKKIRISHKVNTKKGIQIHNTPYEIDIIAIRPKPLDKIIGEVKGWRSGLHKWNFTKLVPKPTNKLQKRSQERMHLINDEIFRKSMVKGVENVYGEGFKIVIFCHHINKKDEKEIKNFAKNENFKIIAWKEILKRLDEIKDTLAYSNEPITQLLRIQKSLNQQN